MSNDLRIEDYDSLAMAWNDYYKNIIVRYLPMLDENAVMIIRNTFYTGANVADMLKNKGHTLKEEINDYWGRGENSSTETGASGSGV